MITRIHFHESFYEAIKQGGKVQTARVGEPHYPLGIAAADFSDGSVLQIEITGISYKKFNEMSLQEVQKDGFQSKKELWEALIGFYPELKEDAELMLVEFKCIQEQRI